LGAKISYRNPDGRASKDLPKEGIVMLIVERKVINEVTGFSKNGGEAIRQWRSNQQIVRYDK
jgi:hypothetical protein